jgi:hypothetical protein
MAKLTKPGKQVHRYSLKVGEPRERKRSRRWARQVCIEKPRVNRVGTGRQARSTGWECSGKAACVRAACARKRAKVQHAARGSVRCDGVLGMA